VLLAACATPLQLAALAAARWPALRVLLFGDVAAFLITHPALCARDLSSRWGVLPGQLAVLHMLRALASPGALAAALPGAVQGRRAAPLTLVGLEIAALVAARELGGLRLQGQRSLYAIIDSGVLTALSIVAAPTALIPTIMAYSPYLPHHDSACIFNAI
jgi:hypothetical protein